MSESKTWLALRIEQVYGSGYGTYAKFIRKLTESGVEIHRSNMSLYIEEGLPPTTLGTAFLLKAFAEALECTPMKILEGHGFELEVVYQNVDNPKARELIRIIKEYAVDDNPKLDHIYDNTMSIVKY